MLRQCFQFFIFIFTFLLERNISKYLIMEWETGSKQADDILVNSVFSNGYFELQLSTALTDQIFQMEYLQQRKETVYILNLKMNCHL